MHKYPAIKPRELVKVLNKAGFYEVRSKGSHLQFKKGNLLVTVPMHNRDLKIETIKSILRQSKMSFDEIIELL